VCAIAIIACLTLTWAIWVRRWTLFPLTEHAKLTERTVTLNLILQLAALFLLSPLSTDTVDTVLHALTGQWNLDGWAGHCCYIGAAGLVGLNVGSRLAITDEQLRAAFIQYFGRPMTIIVPILLALLCQSPNAANYWPDLFDSPTDYWLDAYWTLLCGFVAYVLTQCSRVLLILRRNPQNRRTATLYLFVCVAGVADCLLLTACTWLGINCTSWYWLANSTLAIAFAYSTSRAWRQKVRWFVPTAQ
jgi:hypothetical protein